MEKANNKLKGRRKCQLIVVVSVAMVVFDVVFVVSLVCVFVNVTDQFEMVTRGKPEFDL